MLKIVTGILIAGVVGFTALPSGAMEMMGARGARHDHERFCRHHPHHPSCHMDMHDGGHGHDRGHGQAHMMNGY